MRAISEKQLRKAVRSFIVENNLLREDEEMTDELTKIISKLGVGKEINKTVLKSAMAAGTNRDVKQNRVLADLFMAIIGKGTIDPQVISLLKKAAEESEPAPAQGV